jgi:hypothetical protein
VMAVRGRTGVCDSERPAKGGARARPG